MTNGQNTKALGLEIIHTLSKQYGWTEFPTDSAFTNPWVIGLSASALFLLTCLLFRIIRQRKRRNEQRVTLRL
jgi:hypothetical protein